MVGLELGVRLQLSKVRVHVLGLGDLLLATRSLRDRVRLVALEGVELRGDLRGVRRSGLLGGSGLLELTDRTLVRVRRLLGRLEVLELLQVELLDDVCVSTPRKNLLLRATAEDDRARTPATRACC